MMKYKISLLSIAMAIIVLVSMVAAAGVSAAQPATVGSTSTANVAAAYDGFNTVFAAQGAPYSNTGQTIYWATSTTPADPQTWIPIGVGTNPCVVHDGGTGDFAIFWNNNGVLTGVTTTNNGVTAPVVTPMLASTLPTTTLAAGTGPTAVYAETRIDILYVASGGALKDWTMTGTGNYGTTLGGNVLATPAASTTSTGAGITVVVKGTNAIYEMQYALGGWGGYEKFHDGAIGLGASLSRLSGSPGSMYLFVAGTQGRLWVLYSANDGSTWATTGTPSGTQNLLWNNLGGVLKSAPATAGPVVTITAYVVGGDNGIWSNRISTIGATVTGTWSTSSIVGP
jgi:hypothetical protein